MVKDLIANSYSKPRISMSKEVEHATNVLRGFLFDYVYLTSSADQEKAKIHGLIARLFEYYLAGPGSARSGATVVKKNPIVWWLTT